MKIQKTAYIIFLICLCRFGYLQSLQAQTAKSTKKPNIIVIFADDMGYGDLGSFGNRQIKTPNLDRMAEEGIRLTNFYVTSSVCTPSRAGLLTGRYPIRSGLTRVLGRNTQSGIDAAENTLAEALKTQGYKTAAIGKWHLGQLPQYLPINHGFDYYFGIPYSNDMEPVQLLRNTEIIENPARQETLTERYTAESIKFIEQSKKDEKPFFLYLAHTFPHVPLFASEKFKGKSAGGLYGDTIEELDSSTGEILNALKNLKLDASTLVIFTSDNGPWLDKKQDAGSAGILRGGKFSVYEGGIREPFIARYPSVIPAKSVGSENVISIDLFPTLLKLAGGKASAERALDGVDIMQILTGKSSLPERTFYFYSGETLQAIKRGKWKLHLPRETRTGATFPTELYDLSIDESETKNVAAENQEVVRELTQAAETFDREAKRTATAPKNPR